MSFGSRPRRATAERMAAKSTSSGTPVNARDDEGYLFGALGVGEPVGKPAHILFGDALAVVVAQDRFQDYADADGEARDFPHALSLKLRQRVKLARQIAVDCQGLE